MGRSTPRLTRALGELETDVMRILWATVRPLPVRDVRDRLAAGGRDLAYNTIMTVLVRLTRKALARRTKRDGMWHYEASLSEAEYRAHVSGQVLRDVWDVAPEGTLAYLVDVLAEDEPEALEELARLIQARYDRRKAGHREP